MCVCVCITSIGLFCCREMWFVDCSCMYPPDIRYVGVRDYQQALNFLILITTQNYKLMLKLEDLYGLFTRVSLSGVVLND